MLSTLRVQGVRGLRQSISKCPNNALQVSSKTSRFCARNSSSTGSNPKQSVDKFSGQNPAARAARSVWNEAKDNLKQTQKYSHIRPPDKRRFPLVKMAAAAAVAYYGLKFLGFKAFATEDSVDTSSVDISVQEMLRDYLMKGYVDRIYIVNRTCCRVFLKVDVPEHVAGKTLEVQIGSPEAFETKVDQVQGELGWALQDQVPIHHLTENSFASSVLPHLPTLLILGSLLFIGRGMRGAIANHMHHGGSHGGGGRISGMGRASTSGKKDIKSSVKFADVAGLGHAKKEVVEFVDFLKDSSRFLQLGARVPKGGLLVGPPGTGKTLLAKAVAGEAGVPFFAMSGSEFVEMYTGVGPSRVRDLFSQARQQAPSIIFIDEIDAIGRKRGGGGASSASSQERENTLNQLLVEMDGFSSSSNVIVLASTNRADILDDALKRPGRFDRQIAIDKPDLVEREEIFKVHLKVVTLEKSLNMDTVAHRMASLTPGFAGADIANICNEAAIFAARRHAMSVEMLDFERATERVIGGVEKRHGLMNEAEKRTVALHESGHAVAGWFLEHADPLLKVSVIPRSNGALGFAQYLPRELSLYSKEAILDKIAVTLAGRAAEELFGGHVTTGATDDLHKVTKMAYAMVATYGMSSQVGLLSYGERNASEQFYKPYSEETARLIDLEVRSIVDEQYARVKALLTECKSHVTSMSDALAAKETLVLVDLEELLGERPFAHEAAGA